MVESNRPQPKRLGGATGKGFLPGKSGNPGGQPGGIAELRALARAHTPEAIGALVEIVRARKAPPAARVAAATAILDRGWGRPTVGEPGADGAQLLRIITGVARDE